MKNYFLKSFFWILLLVVAISCSKSESVEPDAASQVAGEYKVTEMTQGGITVNESLIALAGGTVTITMTRKEANIAEMRFYAKIGTNVTDQKANVLLEKSGNVILLKDLSQKMGQYQDGKIDLDLPDGTGGRVLLKATRK